MPTNLPPEALEAERRYRGASSVEDKVAALEDWLRAVPKHKGTDKLRAGLRRRLSKLQDAPGRAKPGSRRDSAYHVEREGAGQIPVIGAPNVGKSSLVCALTNAEPEVSASPYTTWKPTPGMMAHEGVQIQLIDTPPLQRDYAEGALFDLIRRADLILLVVDLQTYPARQIEEAIALLEEHRIVPAQRADLYTEKHHLRFIPLVVLANKCDDHEGDELYEIFQELLEGQWMVVPGSASTGRHLDQLKQVLFSQLGIIRVFAKPPGRDPDMTAPFVLRVGGTVEQLAAKVHKDFLERLAAARVWGTDVFDGQMVGRDHVLHDGDVVELHL